MMSRVNEFEAMRLTRDATSAGEAFGFAEPDVEAKPAWARIAAVVVAACIVTIFAGIGCGLL
jgi:hypothetical protein